MISLDHIAIASTDLAKDTALLEDLLGVEMTVGGRHARYGTHNTLLRLGQDLYLELIAKDPNAPPTERPTWFALDQFVGSMRPANWICACDDIGKAVKAMPADVGKITPLSRDALHWQITVPADGTLPLDGACPTLLQWGEGISSPAQSLPDRHCALHLWEVIHPQAEMLATALPLSDARVSFVTGPEPAFRAHIVTPSGLRVIE